MSLYMQDFVFDSVNTKLPQTDDSFRAELTEYFREYKQQKLTNRIYPEFWKKSMVFLSRHGHTISCNQEAVFSLIWTGKECNAFSLMHLG